MQPIFRVTSVRRTVRQFTAVNLLFRSAPDLPPDPQVLLHGIQRHVTTAWTWLVVITSVQHPMLNDTLLRIQSVVSDLETIRLWLQRMHAAEVHVIWGCASGTRTAAPVEGVVDAHDGG